MSAGNDFFRGFDGSFSDAEARAYAREELIFNVTDDILIIMEDNKITKQELARRLGKSKSFVTQVLSGARNMTLGTLSDICFALGFKPEVKLPVEEKAYEESCKSLHENSLIEQTWAPMSDKVMIDSAFSAVSEFLGRVSESSEEDVGRSHTAGFEIKISEEDQYAWTKVSKAAA